MNELKMKIQAYLDGLNPRERRMVIGAAVILTLFVLYQLLWVPFAGGVSNMQNKVEKQQQDLIWMQQAAEEVRSLSGNTGSRSAIRSGSLLGVIEKTARESGLGSSIRKVQPEGQDGVRIWLDKVSFDSVMNWLNELQNKQGVSVDSFSAEKTAEAGRVNVRMLVESK